jgi:hypothetical protein
MSLDTKQHALLFLVWYCVIRENSSAALMLSFADASKNCQPRFFASAPHLTSLANETSELMEETIMYRSAYKYRFA